MASRAGAPLVRLPSPPGYSCCTIAAIFPIEHLAAATHLASVRGSFSSALAPADLLVLAAWAFAAVIFAARRFSWLPAAATA